MSRIIIKLTKKEFFPNVYLFALVWHNNQCTITALEKKIRIVIGILTTRSHGDLPDADDVVGVTGKQGLTVGGPGHGETLGWVTTSVASDLRAELLNHVFALKIPDLDGGSSSGTQPVPGTEKYKLFHTIHVP